ncbi:formyltetrahydrofolate-dependent phosphoribosylglycinamide formyltransferase [Orenia metallireducens]|uniref:Phosphoribosylglycinamide formyltransferase n=1 Tax=Orenia metallireducens TaxID=1413210 RepID=A0A285G4C8_9FIRM|nr:phosphoribosylglycinamide formyltransferase [Orenia metallireducens]PRX31805.1 formyltetrahydrofolate-dependent phosphoribosylglycinamide formyltransferase [Orenia metallireducens]SNY17386.1 formyltetrahydrofolate-dependent phosphoribosylglycinamide formyltransferase [Orenia metallireducens]
MLKIGVLASGRGSNLQSIIDSIEAGELQAEIKVVISDKEGAKALDRAAKYGIANKYINPKAYESKENFEQAMIDVLKKYGVELVVMAGFMRILSPYFVRYYRNRVMNIHPSLLPSFTGLHAQKQALDYGVKLAGCTVHFADEGMDTGPIILQAAVPVKDDDTEETLAKRILVEEHRIYPEAIRLFSEGRVEVKDGKVKIKNRE